MKPRIVYIDVDGTVADVHTPLLLRYNREYDDNWTVDNITQWRFDKLLKPECGAKVFEYFADPTLYAETAPLLGALRAVQALRTMGCRVVFATSTMRGVADAKRAWLERHGFLIPLTDARPHDDLVYIHDKQLLRGTGWALIDDREDAVAAWGEGGYLLGRPWNSGLLQWGGIVGAISDRIEAETRRQDSVALEAHAAVHGPRGKDYGHPYDNDARIAAMAHALFGWAIKPRHVWMFMNLVKLSREVNRPKRDNRVDIAGYAETGEMVAQRTRAMSGLNPAVLEAMYPETR